MTNPSRYAKRLVSLAALSAAFLSVAGMPAAYGDAPAASPAPAAIPIPSPDRTWTAPANVTYYIDSREGSDDADGLSPEHSWRSLDKANSGVFSPGDRILLRAGSSWSGFFAPGGGGAPGASMVIDEYGKGPKPKIDAQGLWRATVRLFNISDVTVRNLDIANHAPIAEPLIIGVEVNEVNFGTARDIVLDALDVHDVTGNNVKSEGGNGIYCACSGTKVPTRFDGLLIENCHLTRTDRNGIRMRGAFSRTKWYPNLHVVIRHNLLEDIGGDGIVAYGCDGATVEFNTLHGGRMRAPDYAAGIWPWDCDNTVIQHNEVSGMKGARDAEGFDSDYNCRNSLFQYNYSHDNDGGFMLICDNGASPPPGNIGNSGTVVRYNVSIDDGLHTFNFTGPTTNTTIYNNTFYLGKSAAGKVVAGSNWGGAWAQDIHFLNNLFYAAKPAAFDFGGMRNIVFTRNLFWGDYKGRPADAQAITANPMLADPGGVNPIDYRPLPGSPCLSAGVALPDNGGRDFRGIAIPAGEPPNVGAFQTP